MNDEAFKELWDSHRQRMRDIDARDLENTTRLGSLGTRAIFVNSQPDAESARQKTAEIIGELHDGDVARDGSGNGTGSTE